MPSATTQAPVSVATSIEVRRAEALGVPEAVTENQPALGVGVEYLDGLTAGAGQDVTGLGRASPRHVLGGRDDADDFDRRLEQRDGAHGADHRRAAGHVVLHPLHAVCGLDGDATGVERDALAHEPEDGRGRRARRIVRHDDHARRFGAAAGDTEQQPHVQPLDFVFVEDLDFEPGVARDGRAALGKHRRRQDIRRLVAEIARHVRRLAEDPAAFDGLLESRGRRLRRASNHEHLFRRFAASVLTLVAIAAERRESQPFGDGLYSFEWIERQALHERDPRDVPLSCRQCRGGREAAQAFEVRACGGSGADERHARCLPALQDRRQKKLVRLSLDFFRSERALDRAPGRLSEAGHCLQELFAFDERDYKEICLDLSDRGSGERHRWAHSRPNHMSSIIENFRRRAGYEPVSDT